MKRDWTGKGESEHFLSHGCGFDTKVHFSNLSSCQEATRREEVIALAVTDTQTHLHLQL